MGYIDVHSHLLPGIDDGAEDMATSLEMAKIAVAEGVTRLVCTPHIRPGRFDNSLDTITASFHAFRDAVREGGIDLEVAFAAECYFSLEIMSDAKGCRLPFLGEWEGRKVLLLEFNHGYIPFGAEKLTWWLNNNDIIPIIAHPERNRGFIAEPAKLKPFLQQGCLMQLTSASFTGRFGRSAQSLAEDMAKQGVVTVIGSDAHDLETRPPFFRETHEKLSELIGEKVADTWLIDNPRRLTESLFAVQS